MAITPLTFTPETGYKDAVTFPDPATEADAREQIQELHDQTKAYVATLIAELLSVANGKGASQIGVEDSEEKFTGANVEAVLAELNNLLSTHVGETVSKTISISRDLSVTGDQAITGVGFAPKSVIADAIVSGVANKESRAMAAKPSLSAYGSSHGGNIGADTRYPASGLIYIIEAGGIATSGIIKSWDADGITITWTKTSTGATGMVTCYLLFQSHY